MKKIKLIFISFFCLLFVCNTTCAQKRNKNFSGEITYSITFDKLSEEVKAFSAILPTTQTMLVKDSTTLLQISVMGQTFKIINTKGNDTSILLLELSGMVIAIEVHSKEAEDIAKIFNLSNPFSFKDSSFSIEKNMEIKNISGYTCEGYNIYTLKDGEKQLYANTFYCPEFLPWSSEYGCLFYSRSVGNNETPALTMEITKITSKKLTGDMFSIPANAIRMSIQDLLDTFGETE